jgi:predicted MFS family arabinose efflux permease
MAAVALVSSIIPLLICVLLFSIGMVMSRPGQQTTVAALSRPQALGAYMGIGQLSVAFGAGAGNFFGGALYDVSQARDLGWVPWVIFGVIGASSALGLTWIKPTLDRRIAENEALDAIANQEPAAPVAPS